MRNSKGQKTSPTTSARAGRDVERALPLSQQSSAPPASFLRGAPVTTRANAAAAAAAAGIPAGDAPVSDIIVTSAHPIIIAAADVNTDSKNAPGKTCAANKLQPRNCDQSFDFNTDSQATRGLVASTHYKPYESESAPFFKAPSCSYPPREKTMPLQETGKLDQDFNEGSQSYFTFSSKRMKKEFFDGNQCVEEKGVLFEPPYRKKCFDIVDKRVENMLGLECFHRMIDVSRARPHNIALAAATKLAPGSVETKKTNSTQVTTAVVAARDCGSCKALVEAVAASHRRLLCTPADFAAKSSPVSDHDNLATSSAALDAFSATVPIALSAALPPEKMKTEIKDYLSRIMAARSVHEFEVNRSLKEYKVELEIASNLLKNQYNALQTREQELTARIIHEDLKSADILKLIDPPRPFRRTGKRSAADDPATRCKMAFTQHDGVGMQLTRDKIEADIQDILQGFPKAVAK